jgi:hypothetical protein
MTVLYHLVDIFVMSKISVMSNILGLELHQNLTNI